MLRAEWRATLLPRELLKGQRLTDAPRSTSRGFASKGRGVRRVYARRARGGRSCRADTGNGVPRRPSLSVNGDGWNENYDRARPANWICRSPFRDCLLNQCGGDCSDCESVLAFELRRSMLVRRSLAACTAEDAHGRPILRGTAEVPASLLERDEIITSGGRNSDFKRPDQRP